MLLQRANGFSDSSVKTDINEKIWREDERNSFGGFYMGPRSEVSSGKRRFRSENRVIFFSSASSIPSPLKKSRGEDAYFVTSCGTTIGVADGVGGWAEYGIDSGKYSRQLCRNASQYVSSSGDRDPKRIMHHAYQNSTATGTSTCCIISISGSRLQAANLGDSGFIVLRPNKRNCLNCVLKSEEQQYDFNTPKQLGTNSIDMPEDAQSYEFELCSGDIIVAGTDGLFDNLSVEDIIAELEENPKCWNGIGASARVDSERKLKDLSNHIAKIAFLVSKDSKISTPFSKNAARHKLNHRGGKMDDITVIVSIVQTAEDAERLNSAKPRKETFYLPPNAFDMTDEYDSGTESASGSQTSESSQASDLSDVPTPTAIEK